MFLNITLHYFRIFGSFSNLYPLVKMLTAVMMKVEGVTKEGSDDESDYGRCYEGGEGKKDQRVRIGLGGEGPSLRAADKKCKTCWRA